MKKQINTWQLVADSLKNKIPVVLLYVLESKGSSPGRQGFFMAVSSNGKMEGSIGGGIMEHKFVELAKEKLIANSQQLSALKKQVHDKSSAKDQSGMICSGEQTIWLYQLNENDLPFIDQLLASLTEIRNGTLILSASGISFSADIPEKDFYFSMKDEKDWVYKEKTGYKNHLSIIGGGHCSLAFSKLMSTMDFYIDLYDDRQHLKTMEENDFVHEKKIIDDYAELKTLLQPKRNHYVVIMTFGYRTDDIALRALQEKKFKYLGVLGSKTKMRKLLADLKEEGIGEDILKRIHTPIGLPIKSETPEEIAISIAAEIIKIKNAD